MCCRHVSCIILSFDKALLTKIEIKAVFTPFLLSNKNLTYRYYY